MRERLRFDETRETCRRALEEDADLAPLTALARRRHPALEEARAILPLVRTDGDAVSRLARLKAGLADEGVAVDGGAFERWLIVQAAHDSVGRLASLPVDERVQDLFCQNFCAYAAAPGKLPEPFDLARASFVSSSRLATLSRFPAGQLDWEVSGIPRSWLSKVSRLALPRLAWTILTELRGFRPVFFSHLNPNRRNQTVLLERESLRSYHRMARSMERQPAIRGLVTASWLHSPDTFVVSPHLAWLNTVFLENGGYVLPLGLARPGCGALYRSPERQRAFDAGIYRPTQALVIWPRAAMLAWMSGHQELGAERTRPSASASMREVQA